MKVAWVAISIRRGKQFLHGGPKKYGARDQAPIEQGNSAADERPRVAAHAAGMRYLPVTWRYQARWCCLAQARVTVPYQHGPDGAANVQIAA